MILNPNFLIGPDYEAAHELCRGFDLVLANTLASWPVARAAHVVGARVVWYLHETLVARQFVARIHEIPSTLAMADLLVAPTRQTSLHLPRARSHPDRGGAVRNSGAEDRAGRTGR